MQNSSRKARKPAIAVTLGDPAGIGPEIVASLFATFRPVRSETMLVGSSRVLDPYLSHLQGRVSVVQAEDLDRSLAGFEPNTVRVVDTGCRDRYSRGRDSLGGGRHAGLALEVACRMVKGGVVKGLVTAPISKKSLSLAGYRFTGHTELFARYLGAPHCQMVMVHRDLRVVPITRHIPIRKISPALTPERVLAALRVVNRALKEQFGVRKPRIAVTGLNPHAGDGGLVGNEEIQVIKPALRQARRGGITVTGPVPADTLFQEAGSGTFDAFVTMYHDQGLIPFKMMAKRRGVNVTVGLPVVRTSVDHGVAYDIVGKGVASCESLKQAYLLAEKLVARGRMRRSR
ncbi:MAG: 4-hydroxythreonine-4-phosphate dehydrogenase PdxA [Candidatus Krumholzibacteria bacterium]|nr:4-hydroxythreonine-4-phosphate dehydrogenase PdxA [Candidatus Krumholzibacteria bacterium]